MRLLAEIERHKGVNRMGRAIRRDAVRAIVFRDSQILLLYTKRDGSYVFPGGGVDSGESHVQALARELREECGAELLQIQAPFGKVVEYAFPKEPDFEVFCMTSYYYLCTIGEKLGPQGLKGYEQDLGLEPHWTTVDKALAANEALLTKGVAAPWTQRDTTVLRLIQENLLEPIKEQ